ncbi:MAG: phosphoribosyl-AMP cyclohydrolase [Parahaliea sp.]
MPETSKQTDISAQAAALNWNEHGLVPAIAQDWYSGEILMLAWMNREALELTVREGRAVYWSRSRGKLWRKGEDSGHIQQLHELRLDCDRDTVLMKVEQVGGIACHTGRKHCFYQRLQQGEWVATEPVLKQPGDIYGGRS